MTMKANHVGAYMITVVFSIIAIANVNRQAQFTESSADFTFTNSSSSSSSKASFDRVHDILQARATAPVIKSTRQQFTLDGWNRGSGGLDDTDRTMLGKLYYKANSVFEYGLGESTYIASFVGVPRYSGVDSDAVWVTDARKKANMDHFRFYFADIGNTMAWGHPVNKAAQKIQYNYELVPLLAENKPFDVYLVDGRYRVACACISFLHAMKYGGDMTKIMVGIHDNDHNESRGYDALKRVASVVEEGRKLWVYKLDHNITEDDVFQLWSEYESDPRR